MSVSEIVSTGFVVVFLVAAVAVYWRNTDKVIFPALLVVGGIFLGGAQQVSANFGGILDVKFANQVTEANDANFKALAANEKAIADLTRTLGASQQAFDKYRVEVDARFRQLNASPVAYREPRELRQANSALQIQLRRVETANKNARDQSQALKSLTQPDTIKQ